MKIKRLLSITLALCLLIGVMPISKTKTNNFATMGAIGIGTLAAIKLFERPAPQQKTSLASLGVGTAFRLLPFIGGAAALYYFVNKFFPDSKLAEKLTKAKKEINEKIKDLKTYTKKRFDKTDKKIDQVDDKVDRGFHNANEKMDKLESKIDNIKADTQEIKDKINKKNKKKKSNKH